MKYFTGDDKSNYAVPDEQVDSFMKSVTDSGITVTESPVKSFQTKDGQIFDVPEYEVDKFLKSTSDSGLVVEEVKPKEDLGVLGTMKTEKEARLGRKMGGLEAAARYLPVVGKVLDAEQMRQENNEKRLALGEETDPTKMIALAQSIGIDQSAIDELVSRADSGQRSIAGFRMGLDADVLKKGFAELTKDRYAQRLATRAEAQQKLKNAEDLNWLQKAGKGLLSGAGTVVEFANPLTMALGTAVNVVDRVDQMAKQGDTSETAAIKALAGAAAEQVIWSSPVVGNMFKLAGRKLVKLIPGAEKLVGAAASGVTGAAETVVKKLGESESGRLLLKTGEVLGKADEKLHFGSLPKMIMKTRLTQFADEVVGLNYVGDAETGQRFGDWLKKFVSIEDNAELLTGLIGIHAAFAGASAIKAHRMNKAFREGREDLVGEYIGYDQAKKLNNEDLQNIYTLITAPDLTVEKANAFLDGIRDEKLSKLRAAATKVGETLEQRRTITPEMEESLDAKINQYAEGNETISAKIKEDVVTRLQDNRGLTDPDMLEEIVARSARRFNPEARRMKAHDLRGNRNVGEQMTGIEELGVTSWEQAEQEGLTEKDSLGRYTGGARQALNISIHGTAKLKAGVRDGRISGDLAEDLLTTAQCELGARSVEERARLIDGILDEANGDENLARRILAKLEARDTDGGTEATPELIGRLAEEAKVESVKERNPAATDAEARGAAVEPVETEDGKITTVGAVVGTEPVKVPPPEPKPQTVLEGVENAERLKGTKLRVTDNGIMNCNTFPELRVQVSADGIAVEGLTAELMAKPENAADAAAVLAQLSTIAKRNGVQVRFASEDAAKVASAIGREVREQGLARAQKKLDTRAKLFGILFKTTLGTGVTYDEASFREALGKTGNGRQFVDNHGNIYGFVDGEGMLHFNPTALNFNTPIHEYGHLALEAVKGINSALWKRGMELIRQSDYYREIEAQSKIDGHEYGYLRDRADAIADEALATMIGDRGEKLVTERGLDAQLKAWLKEVWRAFKGALGVADLTEEQIERMTLGEFVDTINAELLRGSEFGVRRRPSGLSRREAAEARARREENQHYADEQERAEFEAEQRWQNSGMGLVDYIRSRAEEGDPDFDYDWEIAREIAHDRAAGRFQARHSDANGNQAKFAVVPSALGDGKQKYYEVPFGTAVDKIVKAKKPIGREAVFVSATPKPLQEIGLARLPVMMNQGHVLSCYYDVGEGVSGKHLHGLHLQLKSLPNALERPLMIIASETRPNDSVVTIVKMRNRNGDQIFVPIEINGVGRAGSDRVDAHIVTSSYGRRNAWTEMIAQALRDEVDGKVAIFYLDKSEARTIENRLARESFNFGRAEVQSLRRSKSNVWHSIADDGSPVNGARIANQTDTQQFKNWFGSSKMVDEKGNARIYYHGTSQWVPEKMPKGKAIFSDDKTGTGSGDLGFFGRGFYFAYDKGEAQMYGAHVVPVYLKMEKPFNFEKELFTWHGEKNRSGLEADLPYCINLAKKFPGIVKDQKATWFEGFDDNGNATGYHEVSLDDVAREAERVYDKVQFEIVKEFDETIGSNGGYRIFVKAEPYYETENGHRWKTYKLSYECANEESAKDRVTQVAKYLKEVSFPNLSLPRGRDIVMESSFSEELKRRGYDGIIQSENGDEAVVFNSNQIKSASDNIGTFDPANPDIRMSAGGRATIDPSVFVFDPNAKVVAMGTTEQNAAGLAAGIEKKEALRPWTKKMSPADLAKPIAFDAADMVMFWRAVSGSLRNPHVQKGERIAGRPNAIGLNVGGDRIEIVSKLFGVIDAGDIEKLRGDCRTDGFFRNEDADWCASHSKAEIAHETDRSKTELDRRTRALYHDRVVTGNGGSHYATQVLGHEIGHTLARLPADARLGPVGDAMKTLYDSLVRELRRKADPLLAKSDTTVNDEIKGLIAWWHGQEEMPKYYEKPEERFAELFGIFLTQPASVEAMAPKAYDACVKVIAENEKLSRAYRKICGLKWSGASNDALMKRLGATWERGAQEQYRQLTKLTKESVSLKRDWFNWALNDRFGPMFAMSERSVKAEKQRLEEAVRKGVMSRAEADDRLKARTDEINALRSSLYNWQRQSGGATRLMIAGFDEVKFEAERDGVNWNDVRDYAHLMRVIELGGRATAHGIDPARAAAILEEKAGKLGPEAWAKVEKTWKAYRAVYERFVLEDPNVREIFDDATNKMLWENKHYVTMKHRMGVEEAAEWTAKIEAYRKANGDAWDPCIDIQQRLHRGIGNPGEGGQGFVLHQLTGSFEATEDPIASTMKRAIEIKESAARNHLLKQMSETLRACGVKGVFDTTDSRGHSVDASVYGKLNYMANGVKHELIVPKVIYKSFKAEVPSFGMLGETMRFIRNTMTLWNPAFINRAYLIDKSSLETNLEGLHKPLVDVLSEALCFRGLGVPLYIANNYLARFTPLAKTWIGRLLWNENTVNHYAYRAQKIARMVYEGKFGERLAEAQKLRAAGATADAAEIEQNVAVAREMLKRNVFQSQYEFNAEQRVGFNTDDILRTYGYRIAGEKSGTLRGKSIEALKSGGRLWNRFEEEQEACTKIIAYLYQMKRDAAAGKTSEADAAARARLTIEQGGTPNLAARGVAAGYIENALGFFWNVRKEGSLRTVRALRDHPTEWITKNLVQTAAPALLKALMVTGGLDILIRKLFDDDEEKIRRSWWAPAVLDHTGFVREAMKCVPGYYQRNYNVIPLAKFGDEVVSLRVKYSPEEFAIQNAVHAAMQKLGADPTDPSVDWSTLTAGVWEELIPNIFGRNYILDALGSLVGPMIGTNPYDFYRKRKFYDKTTWEARWAAPGNMAQEMAKTFWNYSPLATFTSVFKNGQERKLEHSEVPEWLDMVLQTPFVRMIPASMLAVTSKDSYVKALKEVDDQQKAYARVVARDVLVGCIERGSLGGFAEGLKDLRPEYRMTAVRHVLNGWRQYQADPRAQMLKGARAIKDPKIRKMAMEWVDGGARNED